MRIAYVSGDRGIAPSGCNGASTHVRELANALVAHGAQVTLFAPGAQRAPGIECDVVDIETEPLLPLLRRLTARASTPGGRGRAEGSEAHGLLLNQPLLEHLERLHADAPLDVVYERYSLWSCAGLQFARRRGLPFLLEVNAPLVAQQEEYRTLVNAATAQGLERLLLSQADRVIVPSRALGDYVAARGGRRRVLRVLPCGVARAFLAPTDHLPAHRGSTFVLGFLGSLKPWHGLELLMAAFQRLRGLWPGYRLLVVGDGPLRGMLETFAATWPPGTVELVGAVPYAAVPSQLARMDVGLAPYPELPLFYFSPLKIFEYAAAAVPIVASASGQIAEVLTHRATALLHPPGSTTKIVKHVEELRARPDLRARLARRARRVVAKAYTWDRLGARLLAMARRARGA